jgi:hypothetical protein
VIINMTNAKLQTTGCEIQEFRTKIKDLKIKDFSGAEFRCRIAA